MVIGGATPEMSVKKAGPGRKSDVDFPVQCSPPTPMEIAPPVVAICDVVLARPCSGWQAAASHGLT
ncbi:hypothetical protein Ahu01nite_030260 [Winogradskya humida]|uniref:Uncharacterized protein n=1 Tax=Winogradskya humida TaxID=113566 RepID=A0ABQ3ZMW6_9ACTN|nr:hypothetical protein Ahu01nite_030260 [Actinoplanes humidus]